jgi:hypothetical protein
MVNGSRLGVTVNDESWSRIAVVKLPNVEGGHGEAHAPNRTSKGWQEHEDVSASAQSAGVAVVLGTKGPSTVQHIRVAVENCSAECN